MHQIPDVFVRFNFAESRHSAKANAILNDPEKLSIGVALYLKRCQIRGSRIHPAAGLRGNMAIHPVAHGTLGAISLVAFDQAGLRPGRFIGNSLAALSRHEEALGSCRQHRLCVTWLCKGGEAEPAYQNNSRSQYDHQDSRCDERKTTQIMSRHSRWQRPALTGL